MAHISQISNTFRADLSVCSNPALVAAVKLVMAQNGSIQTSFMSCFSDDFLRIQNIGEFPNVGNESAIINVPVFGQAITAQIQGQGDKSPLAIQINYVAEDWKPGTPRGALIDNYNDAVFRLALCNSIPASYASTSDGLGSIENSQYFWIGRLKTLEVFAKVSGATSATLTMVRNSNFYGAYSNERQMNDYQEFFNESILCFDVKYANIQDYVSGHYALSDYFGVNYAL
jgi:hypothetical protein